MLEQEIFKKSDFIIEKCINYGFIKETDAYVYHKTILNNSFEIIITMKDNDLKGIIIDKELKEEYTSFRIENQIGEFSSTIRSEYKKLLMDIRDKCTINRCFIYPQANRISEWINHKYSDQPEFLWDDDKNAVFRNKKNKKWYGIIMYINQNKIDEKNQMIEVMNVKLPPDEIEELLKKKGYYKAYHMNKKHWITFILDDTIDDKELHDLIEKSYQYTI